MTEERKNPIEWIYSTKDNEELLKRYDEWAASYDDDLTTQEEHRAPAVAAEVLYRLVPKNAKLLDAGAGTGLLGEVLACTRPTDFTDDPNIMTARRVWGTACWKRCV